MFLYTLNNVFSLENLKMKEMYFQFIITHSDSIQIFIFVCYPIFRSLFIVTDIVEVYLLFYLAILRLINASETVVRHISISCEVYTNNL